MSLMTLMIIIIILGSLMGLIYFGIFVFEKNNHKENKDLKILNNYFEDEEVEKILKKSFYNEFKDTGNKEYGYFSYKEKNLDSYIFLYFTTILDKKTDIEIIDFYNFLFENKDNEFLKIRDEIKKENLYFGLENNKEKKVLLGTILKKFQGGVKLNFLIRNYFKIKTNVCR